MRPLVLHDWRAAAATVAVLALCAVPLRRIWRSHERLPATGEDRRHLRLSIAGQSALHLAALGAAFAGPAVPGPPWVVLAAGLALYAAGQALRGWAMAELGKWFQGALVLQERHQVVATGPFRFLRHPAYAGGILRATGLGLVLGSWLSLALLALGTTAFVVWRIAREDAVLAALPGYEEYRRRTAALVPRIW